MMSHAVNFLQENWLVERREKGTKSSSPSPSPVNSSGNRSSIVSSIVGKALPGATQQQRGEKAKRKRSNGREEKVRERSTEFRSSKNGKKCVSAWKEETFWLPKWTREKDDCGGKLLSSSRRKMINYWTMHTTVNLWNLSAFLSQELLCNYLLTHSVQSMKEKSRSISDLFWESETHENYTIDSPLRDEDVRKTQESARNPFSSSSSSWSLFRCFILESNERECTEKCLQFERNCIHIWLIPTSIFRVKGKRKVCDEMCLFPSCRVTLFFATLNPS